MKQISLTEEISIQEDKSVFDSLEVDRQTLKWVGVVLEPWYVYIVRCSDSTLYCGISNNVQKRIVAHNSSKGAKYTKTRLPVELVYSEKVGTMSDAMKRERQIKKMARSQKLSLIASVTESGYVAGS